MTASSKPSLIKKYFGGMLLSGMAMIILVWIFWTIWWVLFDLPRSQNDSKNEIIWVDDFHWKLDDFKYLAKCISKWWNPSSCMNEEFLKNYSVSIDNSPQYCSFDIDKYSINETWSKHIIVTSGLGIKRNKKYIYFLDRHTETDLLEKNKVNTWVPYWKYATITNLWDWWFICDEPGNIRN